MTGHPRVLVLGAGSIGVRHARNLAAAGADVSITDPIPGRAEAVEAAVAVPFPDRGFEGYDGVVVASPSSLHATHAEMASRDCDRVLVEKPLATTAVEAEALARAVGDRVMVGYNLRLHAPLERLVALVHEGAIGSVLGIHIWFGSYLPDWRPTTDYRATYSARADLGGGVLFDAIHELDILLWLLQDGFEVVGAVVGNTGTLDIDTEDTVKAVLRHSTGAIVDLSLDYLSRRYRRGVEVVGESSTIRLDWARSVLEREDRDSIITEEASTPLHLSYEREARRFLEWIAVGTVPPVGGPEGARSVRLAERLRECAG